MLIWQILAVILILLFVVIAVLAFIEPGPLHRRSRGRRPGQTDDIEQEQKDQSNS